MLSEKILTDKEYIEFENEILKGRLKFIEDYYDNLIKQFPKNAKVLDLGCGKGDFVTKLNKSGFTAIGIDANKKHADNNEFIKYGFLPDTLKTIENDTFDVIVSFHLIEHLDNDVLKTMFKEMHRILKTEGQVFLETPNTQSLFVMSKYYYQDPTHLMPRHPNLYGLLMKIAGFNNVKIEHLMEIVEESFVQKKFVEKDSSISDYICEQLNSNFLRLQNLLFDKAGNILITCSKNKIKDRDEQLQELSLETSSQIKQDIKKSESHLLNIEYTQEIINDIRNSLHYNLFEKKDEIYEAKSSLSFSRLLFISDTRLFLMESYYRFLKRLPNEEELLEWYRLIYSGIISRLDIYFIFRDSPEAKNNKVDTILPLSIIMLKKIGFGTIMKKISYFKGNLEVEKLKNKVKELENTIGNMIEYLENQKSVK